MGEGWQGTFSGYAPVGFRAESFKGPFTRCSTTHARGSQTERLVSREKPAARIFRFMGRGGRRNLLAPGAGGGRHRSSQRASLAELRPFGEARPFRQASARTRESGLLPPNSLVLGFRAEARDRGRGRWLDKKLQFTQLAGVKSVHAPYPSKRETRYQTCASTDEVYRRPRRE